MGFWCFLAYIDKCTAKIRGFFDLFLLDNREFRHLLGTSNSTSETYEVLYIHTYEMHGNHREIPLSIIIHVCIIIARMCVAKWVLTIVTV